jgi:hypothetical protein
MQATVTVNAVQEKTDPRAGEYVALHRGDILALLAFGELAVRAGGGPAALSQKHLPAAGLAG